MLRTLPNFLTETQMQALASSPDPRTIQGKRDRAILGLLCASALRASELCQLQVRDLHPALVFVRRGKGGFQRWVPISERCYAAIQAYLAVCPALRPLDPVFRTLHGQPLTRRYLHKLVTAYQLRLKLPRGVHLLRSSAATRWLNRGLDLQQVRAMLGHADIHTTAIYLGVATDQLQARYKACLETPAVGARC